MTTGPPRCRTVTPGVLAAPQTRGSQYLRGLGVHSEDGFVWVACGRREQGCGAPRRQPAQQGAAGHAAQGLGRVHRPGRRLAVPLASADVLGGQRRQAVGAPSVFWKQREERAREATQGPRPDSGLTSRDRTPVCVWTVPGTRPVTPCGGHARPQHRPARAAPQARREQVTFYSNVTLKCGPDFRPLPAVAFPACEAHRHRRQ